MPSVTGRSRPVIRVAIVLAIWTALAFALTGQASLLMTSAIEAEKDLQHSSPSWALSEIFISSLVECFIWAMLTLAILWLAKRFPLGQGKWSRSLFIHIAACVVCSVLASILSLYAAEFIRKDLVKPTISRNVLKLYLIAKLNNNFFFYAAILSVAHVLNYHRQWRERELLASQLEAKLAQTQLQILKMQLHPHFLFNTLNAISALIYQDVELADRMIAQLGDLLRTTLDNANQQEVSFRQELDFIKPYLEIEKARLGSRLTVDLRIDSDVMDAKVPNLLLQPLVENAIRHGIAAQAGSGRIQIQADRMNGCFHLLIADTGPGMLATTEPAKGIGLANTRARLEKLYGIDQRLDLTNRPEGGLQVDVTIPYRKSSPVVSLEAS